MSLVEEQINEYIKKTKMDQLLNVAYQRRKRTDNAPEGPEKEEAKRKEDRNTELTDNKIKRSGSSLQKAVRKGYSENAKEKKALLRAGYTIKEDPITTGKHNIVKY